MTLQRRAPTEAEAKALASAIRIRILRLCLDEALTNREIATRLGANPATVLHHVRTLVDTGFLAAQQPRRGTRGAREIPYRATGKSWTLNVEEGPGNSSQALLDAFQQEIALVPDLRQVAMSRLGLRLTEAEYEQLRERLMTMLDELAARPRDPAGRPYSLFVALHPDIGRGG